MTSAKLTLVVALALIFGQLQCVALCAASQPVNQSLPPCHSHQSDSSKENPASSCSQWAVIAVTTNLAAAQTQIAPLEVAIPSASEAIWTSPPAMTEFAVRTASPPGSHGLSSLVLRI